MADKTPNLWRLANVSPIFKNGSRVDRKNYRPVSLTSILLGARRSCSRFFHGVFSEKQADFRKTAWLCNCKELCHKFTRDFWFSYKRSIGGTQRWRDLDLSNAKILEIKDKILETTESERDLGIIVSSNFDQKVQINSVWNRANRVLGMLKRTFISKETDRRKIFYISMIRPHLEYAVQVWNPRLIGDIERLEKVQQRATKIPTKLSKMSYDQRLTQLGLTSLEDRRLDTNV